VPPPVPLEATADVLVELVAARRPGQVIVGFAAETGDATGEALAHGRLKLARKRADLLVVNAVGAGRAFEVAENEAVVLAADGGEVAVPYGPKVGLAATLCDQVAARLT
jgi:phosphopantothenoylcysteine decarboxylase/phosphopantothenate--cysteine ligase